MRTTTFLRVLEGVIVLVFASLPPTFHEDDSVLHVEFCSFYYVICSMRSNISLQI